MTARSTFKPEDLAHWYFRLNGFMTIPNFVLHPRTTRGNQRTDVDIFGVRFPFHRELQYKDDQRFGQVTKPYFLIAEVKTSLCELNGPWKKPEMANMEDVLRAIGECAPEMVDQIAKALYTDQRFEDETRLIQIIGVGERLNHDTDSAYRPNLQIQFREIAGFIYQRFWRYRNQKRNHQQWDGAGLFLYNATEQNHDEDEFIQQVFPHFGLKTPVAKPLS